MTNILRRLWPRRRAAARITMGVIAVEVPRAISMDDRRPGPDDLGEFEDCCWWGNWDTNHWRWAWKPAPGEWDTHWLPASVEVLPARCCPPEVQ